MNRWRILATQTQHNYAMTTAAVTVPTFAVEHQQRIANALCKLFGVSDAVVHPSNTGEDIKDGLNAMFRELAHQYEYAKEIGKEQGETGWWLHTDRNHSLGSFAALVNELCAFVDEVGNLGIVADAALVDPDQHDRHDQLSIGFKVAQFTPKVPQYGALSERGIRFPAKCDELTYLTPTPVRSGARKVAEVVD